MALLAAVFLVIGITLYQEHKTERALDALRDLSSPRALVAALVLLDDDFSSIVRAVRLGRRIYTNIKKATGYVLAIHVPIAGIALIPVFMGWPLILMPVHVTFMELILDDLAGVATATVCALAWMELMKQAWKTAG